MSIPIIVNIEAGEECMDCRHYKIAQVIPGVRTEFWCNEFATPILNGKRLPACLAAERKLKDLVEAASYFSICRSESEIEQTEANRIDLRQALAAIKEPNHAE